MNDIVHAMGQIRNISEGTLPLLAFLRGRHVTPDKKILGIDEPFPGYNIADVITTIEKDSPQSITKLVSILGMSRKQQISS